MNKIKLFNRHIGYKNIPWFKMLKYSWLHGANFDDFYLFNFFELSIQERKKWLTTSLRHELTSQVNDIHKTNILKDKLFFTKYFSTYLGREIYSWEEIAQNRLNKYLGPIVIKPRFGQAGLGITFLDYIRTFEDLIMYMSKNNLNGKNFIFENIISNQHPTLSKLNPKSLNTIRIVTFFDGLKVDVWTSFLRIGVKARTDNYATGGIAVRINKEGVLELPSVTNLPKSKSYITHPITKEKIIGVKVPFWKEVLQMVTSVAKIVPEVKSVGWDIAITENGPCLIEGNDNWSNKAAIFSKHGLREKANLVADMYRVYV